MFGLGSGLYDVRSLALFLPTRSALIHRHYYNFLVLFIVCFYNLRVHSFLIARAIRKFLSASFFYINGHPEATS